MQNKLQKQTPLRFMLKRNAFLGVLNFLVMFFSTAFFSFVSMAQSNAARDSYQSEVYLMREVNNAIVAFNAEVMSLLFGGLGFLTALVLFHHLFSRKSAMLTVSLPVTRQRDFGLRMLCAAVLLFMPLILCIALFFIAIAINGLWAYALPAYLLTKFASLVMITLYGLALGVLCAMLAGQFWSAILTGATIAVSLEGLAMLTGEIAQYYLRTLPRETVLSALKLYSPVMTLYKGWVQPLTFIWWPGLLAILAFLGLGFWLYGLRKTEAAERVLAFEPLKGVMEGVLGVVGASAIGYLMVNIFPSEIGLIVGLVAGAALTHLLCRVVFNLNFSKIFAHWPVALASLLVVLVGWGCIRQDVLGYDRYMPTAEATTAISITPSFDQVSRPLSFTSPEALPAALSWAQTMRDASTALPRGFEYSNHGDYPRLVEYTVNGKTVTREYEYDDRAASMPYIRELLETEDFIASLRKNATITALSDFSLYLSPQFLQLLSDKDSLELFGTSDFYSIMERKSSSTQKAYLDAYWQDAAARSAEEWQAVPIFSLSINGSYPGQLPYQEEYVYQSVPVYATDTAFLKAVFQDKAQAVIDYATGGYALDEDVRVVYQTYEEPISSSSNGPRDAIPVTSELVTEPEAILQLVHNASSNRGEACYFYPPTTDRARIYFYLETTLVEQGIPPEIIDYITMPQSTEYYPRYELYPLE